MLYMKFKILIVAAACFLLIGCESVGEKYEKPKLSSTQVESWDGRLEGAISDDDLDPEQLAYWWTTLGDDTLNSLIERAVKSNLDLRTAHAQLRQARAQRNIAQAGHLPSVQANASKIQSQPSSNVSPLAETSTLYSTGLDASWEIDVFGGVKARVDSATSDYQAAEEAQRDVLVTVLAEVALNYVDLRTLQHRKSIAQSTLNAQKDYLEIIKAKEQAGSVTQFDVDQAQSNVEKIQSQIPAFDQQINQTENRLAILLGLPPGAIDDELDQKKFLPVPSVNVAVGVPAQVLRRRPDVRRAERKLAAETYRIGVARAELYPKFTLSGTIGLESLSPSNLLSADSLTFDFGPSVKWNVFSGGRIRQEIEVQSAIQEQALIQYERAILTALEDVENAITAYAQEQLRYRSLKAASQSATRAAKLATSRYEADATDYLSVLDAQRTLLNAEEQQAISEGQITSNLVRLYKSLGGGWTPEAPETEK